MKNLPRTDQMLDVNELVKKLFNAYMYLYPQFFFKYIQ